MLRHVFIATLLASSGCLSFEPLDERQIDDLDGGDAAAEAGGDPGDVEQEDFDLSDSVVADPDSDPDPDPGADADGGGSTDESDSGDLDVTDSDADVGGGATSCTNDEDCPVTFQCECTNSTCTTRVCAPNDCVCGFGVGGTCTTPLLPEVDDANDCTGSYTCRDGACLRARGVQCSGDAQCVTGECECASANCGVRVCADECVCRFGPEGACTAPLDVGTNDPEDCTGGFACDTNAGCAMVESPCGSCAQDCVCLEPDCPEYSCASVSCGACTYVADASCVPRPGGSPDSRCPSGYCAAAGVCR